MSQKGESPSAETRALMSAAAKARKASPETRARISAAMKRRNDGVRGTAPTRDHVCEKCGITFTRRVSYGGQKRYCSHKCLYSDRKMEKSGRWKGGRNISKDGYMYVAIGGWKKQQEHRIAVEKLLGRPLAKGETVHHKNGDKLDNDPRNLFVCSNGFHRKLHALYTLKAQLELPNYRAREAGWLDKTYRRIMPNYREMLEFVERPEFGVEPAPE